MIRCARIDPQTAEEMFFERTGHTSEEEPTAFADFLDQLEFDAACDWAESHGMKP